MAKEKLKKFTLFSQNLLPYEISYLLSILKTKDQEKLEILLRVDHNVHNVDHPLAYDTSIDKRKYSNLQKWIETQLNKIDVDIQLEWITELRKDILVDNVTPEQETSIVNSTRQMESYSFYFIQYYELLMEFRHYLLIRMRYDYHRKINKYLEQKKYDFQRSKLVNDQLHQATFDILGQANQNRKEGIQWKRWLRECLEDPTLDGHNRYMSLIRISFICLKYNILNELETVFQKATTLFDNGNNYSKRLLFNYYDNMLILYDRKRDYDQARYYGYLSIRATNQDSIIYVNNLVNVLIKMRRYQEGLEILNQTAYKLKSSKNIHSIIGFHANRIRCLTKTGQSKQAVIKGNLLLDAYNRDILQFRWHRFFAAYIGALLMEEKYHNINKIISKYKLVDRENQNQMDNPVPGILNMYSNIALFKQNKISQESFLKFRQHILSDLKKYKAILDPELIDLVEELKF